VTNEERDYEMVNFAIFQLISKILFLVYLIEQDKNVCFFSKENAFYLL